ncbi:MAG: hypothetical protein ACTSV5_13285 [Promethearchaeota archaeon]
MNKITYTSRQEAWKVKFEFLIQKLGAPNTHLFRMPEKFGNDCS